MFKSILSIYTVVLLCTLKHMTLIKVFEYHIRHFFMFLKKNCHTYFSIHTLIKVISYATFSLAIQVNLG